MGGSDLNKRKLNFHCEFAPNVGHLFLHFTSFSKFWQKHIHISYINHPNTLGPISVLGSYIGKGATCGTGGPWFNSPLGRVKAAKIS